MFCLGPRPRCHIPPNSLNEGVPKVTAAKKVAETWGRGRNRSRERKALKKVKSKL